MGVGQPSRGHAKQRSENGRCRRGWYGGRPEADRSAGPGGTVRFRFFVLHDHVMVVLRPCEAKLSGLRCLTIIDTEGYAQTLRRGIGGSMYTRKAHETREAPKRGQRGPTGSPRGTGRAPWGGGEVRN